ncbi:MAG: hypothetical protein ACLVJ6_16970 [Merdibacter sp.]
MAVVDADAPVSGCTGIPIRSGISDAIAAPPQDYRDQFEPVLLKSDVLSRICMFEMSCRARCAMSSTLVRSWTSDCMKTDCAHFQADESEWLVRRCRPSGTSLPYGSLDDTAPAAVQQPR